MSPLPFQPFAGQRFAVVGLGRAGLPSARRLVEWGADVLCWDDGEVARAAATAAGFNVSDPVAVAGFPFDALLLSPGIPHTLPRVHPAAAAAKVAGVPVICDAELLYRAVRAAGSKARFVGITGTNGKSTTTALVHHILAGAGRDTEVGGNLGPAALGLRVLGDGGIYVLEMSSYMLERLVTLRFDIGVVLNLSPDHLDRHGGMEGYAAAKQHIFDRQDAAGLAVLGMDDSWGANFTAGRVIPISGDTPQPGGVWAEGRVLHDDAGVIADLDTAPALPGSHNAQNAAAAAAIALALGVAHDDIAAGIASFPGLPHRQEMVGTLDGVAFVNDSKATNADSTARALASYDRVVLIAGGVPKEGGLEPLAEYFPRIAHAVLIGQCAPDFAATLAAHGVRHEIAGTLEAAIPAALNAAKATRTNIVLLSPACASFDQFSGFDARGDAFRAQVTSMMETV
jgi:UDP-N-acetylmuramoylalanine--D-glutamate ligase